MSRGEREKGGDAGTFDVVLSGRLVSRPVVGAEHEEGEAALLLLLEQLLVEPVARALQQQAQLLGHCDLAVREGPVLPHRVHAHAQLARPHRHLQQQTRKS